MMDAKSYWVYIMSSVSGTLYIGSTDDIFRRVWQHKNGFFDGFGKEYCCTRLVYYERYTTEPLKFARERQLKGWRRAKKIALIEKMNPRWQDLAETWGLPMALPGESIANVEARLNAMIRLQLPELQATTSTETRATPASRATSPGSFDCGVASRRLAQDAPTKQGRKLSNH
jgi:putative endonuclease